MLRAMAAGILIETIHGPLPITTDEAAELASRMRLRDQVLAEANPLLAATDTERNLPSELTAAAVKLELAAEKTRADPIDFTADEREAIYNELQAWRLVEAEDGPPFAPRLQALWSALRGGF